MSEANVKIEKTVELGMELTEARKENEKLISEYELKKEETEKLLVERNELLIVLKEKEETESKLNQDITEVQEMLKVQSDTMTEKLKVASNLLSEERTVFAKVKEGSGKFDIILCLHFSGSGGREDSSQEN